MTSSGVRSQVPRVLPVSYVDNFELVCDRLGDLLAASAAQAVFCASLGLEIDVPSLFAWSACATAASQGQDAEHTTGGVAEVLSLSSDQGLCRHCDGIVQEPSH